MHARLQRDARVLGATRSATAEAIDRAGWMHTGDLATMDDEGYLNIVGRSKDMVIRGGENVYPREIEEFLYTHDASPTSRSSACPTRGTARSCARGSSRAPAPTLDEDAVRDYCRGRLAHFKVPRYVIFVDEFPMTVTGKVQKFKMREASVERLGLEDAAAVRSA